MNFIVNIFDKIIFGALLILFFQVPILADHYLQYVSGYFAATEKQVEGFRANAVQHNYPDVYAMIQDLSVNTNSVVRTDAEQKLQTMHEYENLKKTIAALKNGNIYQRAVFMFNPARWDTLKKVYENFKPGIPLSLNDIGFGILTALILSILIVWPFRVVLLRPKRSANFSSGLR
jgi:L-rhamnose mutarotase